MDIDRIQEQFDFVAREYDGQRKKFIPCFDDYYTTITDFLCRTVENPISILDLGAGTGLLTKLVYDRFPKSTYTLVDISNDMLEIARKRFAGCANVHFTAVDYTKSLPDGEFDLVTSALSIHHLSDGDKRDLYNGIYGILPDNGWFANFDQFIASSPEMNSFYNRWWYDYIEQSGLPQEEHDKWMVRKKLDKENTINDTVTMLENTGFKLVECVYSCMKFGVIIARKT